MAHLHLRDIDGIPLLLTCEWNKAQWTSSICWNGSLIVRETRKENFQNWLDRQAHQRFIRLISSEEKIGKCSNEFKSQEFQSFQQNYNCHIFREMTFTQMNEKQF